jgi:cytoskeleton protein RodZ
MTSIGENLCRERTRRGLDLEEVSRDTKISVRFLEYIEAEQFDKLPGGVFTKSFVRQYARALGLDEEEITNELMRIIRPPEPAGEFSGEPRPLAAPEPRLPNFGGWDFLSGSNSSLAAFALVVLVMLVCSGVYSWWQRASRPHPATPAAVVNSAQPGAAPTDETARSNPVPSPAAPAPSTAEPARPVERPRPTEPLGPEAQAAADRQMAQQPGAVQTAIQASSTTIGNGNLKISITAAEETWISARLDGRKVFSGTLQRSQTKVLEANGQVQLLIGNAGGLDISMNGKPIGPVGPRGQIRVVELTPGGYQIVPRKPPVSDPL